MIISLSVLLRMRNVSDKSCKRKSKHIFLRQITFLFENPAFYDIMWQNIVHPDRPQMTIWRMRISCWVTKARNTHSEYIIPIAFPRQQWLRERAWMSRYTKYIAWLFLILSSIYLYAFRAICSVFHALTSLFPFHVCLYIWPAITLP